MAVPGERLGKEGGERERVKEMEGIDKTREEGEREGGDRTKKMKTWKSEKGKRREGKGRENWVNRVRK